MITLPTNYATAIAQGEPSDIIGWFARFKLGAGGDILIGSTHEMHKVGLLLSTMSSNFILNSISPIESSIDPFNCSYSVSNCTLTISDADIVGQSGNADASLSEILDFSTLGWFNREVEIYKYALTESINLYTEGAKFFSGIIHDFSYDAVAKMYTIELVHISETKHKELPQQAVTLETYPKAPQDSIGLPVPILYGEWDMAFSPLWDYHHGNFQVAPSVCIDAHAGTFAFAHHECKELNTDDIAVYVNELSTYGYGLKDKTGSYPSTSVSGPTTASIDLDPGAGYFLISKIYLTPKLKGTQSAITTEDVSKITDRAISTVLALTVDYAAKLNFAEPQITFPGPADTTLVSSFQLHCYVDTYSGANTTRLRIYNPETAAFTDTGSVFSSSGMKDESFGPNALWAGNRTDRYGDAIGDTDYLSWDELSRYEYCIDVGVGATATISIFCISLSDMVIQTSIEFAKIPKYVHRARRDREPTLPYDFGVHNQYYRPGKANSFSDYGMSSIFAQIRGRKCGSFIDDGGRANSFNAADTNVLSNFIAESILRDELGIATADIDTASFDDVTESEMTRMAFSVNQKVWSRDLIKDIGFYSNSIIFPSSDNVWKIFNYPTTPSSSDADLQYQDIKFSRFYWSNPQNLTNEVTIRYQLDHASMQFIGEYHVEDTTSQGSGASGYNYARHGQFECPYIRYGTTSSYKAANDWADKYLANWKDMHICIDFELLNPLYEGLQEGDTVTFVNVPGEGNSDGLVSCNPFGYGGGSADDCMSSFTSPRTKYFLITRCSRNYASTFYSCMQLHDLS